jgi:hypothetical protein
MSKKEPSKYLLIHTHRFGASHEIFTAADFNPMKFTTNEQIIALAKALELNYEPDKDEEITLFHADKGVVALTKADLK